MSRIRDLFAEHRLRCTKQRVALYEALRASRRHPSAEDLFHLVRTQNTQLSLATVYNTLEALCDAGLARKLPTIDGSSRYDADTSDHLHVQIRGEVPEIHDVPAEVGTRLIERLPGDVLAEIERDLGVDIDGISIQILARRRPGPRRVRRRQQWLARILTR